VHSRLREGRENRGHHHGRGIFDANDRGIDRDSHSLKQVGEALVRKHGLLAIPGPI
jgi:hypothetical protein